MPRHLPLPVPLRTNAFAWLGLTALLLTACGGGGSDSSASPEPDTKPDVSLDRIAPFDPVLAAAQQKSLASPAAQPATAQAADTAATVQLGPLGIPPSASEEDAATPQGFKAEQIGWGRAVEATAHPEDLATLWQWQPATWQGQAGQVAAIRFAAEDALALRLGVAIAKLPAGAMLRFYGEDQQVLEQLSSSDWQAWQAALPTADAAALYWSAVLTGPSATLELWLPAGTSPAQLELAVPLLSQITHLDSSITEQLPASQWHTKAGEAGSCQVDVQCQPEFLEQSRSVARLRFVRANGHSYQCTGTLLNDTLDSATPYLLTAEHCINTQAEAASLSTDWLLRAQSCGGRLASDAARQVSGGATLLYASALTDTAFVRMHRQPPAGVLYAGSYFGQPLTQGRAVFSIHHPRGDWQKVSQGQLQGYAHCNDSSCTHNSNAQGGFVRVSWLRGVVEQGSSGAGLFTTLGQERYVIGQLLGGSSSCTAPNGTDYYGRLDTSYQAALHRWLNP